MTPPISQAAVDLIVTCEVSSRKRYEAKYKRPEWPKGRSGVTVAIGYDLGYASKEKIARDFGPHLPAEMVEAMQECSGITGEAAGRLCQRMHNRIVVEWDVAIDVFLHTDVPEWTREVIKRIPMAAKLPPDSLGAIVSTAYNRGASFDAQGDRYLEMRAIKTAIQGNQPEKVPGELRKMKRLWAGTDVSGLVSRREAEAQLFERGIRSVALQIPASTVDPAPKPLPAPPAGAPEASGAGTIVVGTGTVIKDAQEAGASDLKIFAMLVGGLVLAGLVWWLIRAYRSRQPVTARQKDVPTEGESHAGV